VRVSLLSLYNKVARLDLKSPDLFGIITKVSIAEIEMQLVGLLTMVILFLSVIAEPSILLRKSIGFPEGILVPTVGKEMIVSLQIFNIGTSSGYEVTVNDFWPDFDLSSGLESVKWEEVPAGTNYTHTFVIIPNKSGDFKARRATLLYKDSNGNSHETLSNEPYHLRIYELNEVDKRAGAHLIEWVGFFFLSLLVTAFPAGVYGYIKNYYVHGVLAEQLQKKKYQ